MTLKSRQKKIKSMLIQMINFVIDQAIIAKVLKPTVDKTFKIIASPIVSRDNKVVAESVNQFVEGISKAVDQEYIDNKQARILFNLFISQIGVDVEKDYEMDTEANPKKKKPKDEKEVK